MTTTMTIDQLVKQIGSSASPSGTDRRRFLPRSGAVAVTGLTPAILPHSSAADEPNGALGKPFFRTRGLVLITKDLRDFGWPQIAKEAGLSTIGTHVTPSEVTRFVNTEKGQRFLDECQKLGISVEHELHAVDHRSGEVLAYVLGARTDEVFLQLKALLEPFGIQQFYTDGWGAYARHLAPEEHNPGKRNTQRIERKHLNLRTRIKQLARKTICFSKSQRLHDIVNGLFTNRYEFGRAV